MKKTLFAIALLVCSFQTIAFCQTDSAVIKSAVSKLKTLLTDHITEKAYLQFDRPYPFYVAGDNIYFKAYVVKGERHDLSNISAMLHVDLINTNNQLMKSELIQLNNGVGWGDFTLPDTLHKGGYRIRAYTEWMRNEKETNFFEQPISISSINGVDRMAEAAKSMDQPALRFFPEGGTFVADVRTKIAFKAIGTNGLGLDFKGIVTDDVNKEVAKIESAHLGMGVFDLLPEDGKKYKAKVTFADGKQGTFELPEVEKKGITLAINTDDPTKISIEIKANRAYYKENMNKQLNLFIYWAGAIRTINTKLDNEVLGLDLPASTFRTGILKVSLLSETGKPLNERLSFIQNPDLLNLSINAGKATFNKRESVQLNLNAKNKDGINVPGYFSVSIVDESKILVDENAENSILSYLLLTSEVKGLIEKPNYYFNSITKETRANLDALMLTQGYRRFVWKELMNENIDAVTHHPEQNLDIAGTLTTKSGSPIIDSKVILLPLGQTETTDEHGHFKFAKINFQNGTQFILKTPSASGKNAAVIAMDPPAPAAPLTPVNPIDSKYNSNADILASYLNNQRQGVMTASNETNVVLKNDRTFGPKRNDNYRSANLSGPGHADQVIFGSEINNAPNLSSGLNGRARNIDFVNGVPFLKNNQVITTGQSINEAMMLSIDGTIYNPGASVDQVNPANVETVEILREANAAIYGENANAGVMVITTKQGGSDGFAVNKEMSPGVFSIEPMGFYKAREFYSPSYEASQQTSKLPDLRTTIFWKPDVITDASGNASFSYFNADGVGTYRVEVEGIDGNGNLGRQVFRYKVE